MQNDPSVNDVRTIWLNQPTETPTMTSKWIEQKSRELRTKTRRKRMGTLAGPLATGFFYAYAMKEFVGLRQVLQLPFALSLAWSLAGLYFLNRGIWSAMVPRDIGLSRGLEFCRQEIESRRDLVRRSLLWSFGPVMLAAGTFTVALALISTSERGIVPNGLPFLTLLLVWILSWFVIRLREQHKLQREVDELNDLQIDKSSKVQNT